MKNSEPTPNTTEEAEVTTQERPDPERATAVLRPAIAWLNRQSRETKLATQLVHELIRHEDAFRRDAMYEGRLGLEFDRAWSTDVFEGEPFAEPEVERVRGVAAFLSQLGTLRTHKPKRKEATQ